MQMSSALKSEMNDRKEDNKEKQMENTLFKSNDKRKRDNEYDIKKVEEMLLCIRKLEDGKIDFRRCLIDIGKLSGKITINGDIWNKHRYLQQDDRVKQDGIPFEKLSHWDNILSDRQTNSLITEEEFELIKNDLSRLKSKILQVLKSERNEEKNVSKEIMDGTIESISDIIKFSDKYFEVLTAKLIRTEINIWCRVEELNGHPIDFAKKEDRFFIARLLSKIGEFLNELIKDLKIETNGNKNGSNPVLRSFKNSVKIRDKIVHDNRMITEGIVGQNEAISQNLSAIQTHLIGVFCQRSDISLDYEYGNAEKFEYESRLLLKYLSDSNHSSANNRMELLDKFILEAWALFLEDETRRKSDCNSDADMKPKSKIKNKLNNINKQYQSHMRKFHTSEVTGYPVNLKWENKEEILKKKEMLERSYEIQSHPGGSIVKKSHKPSVKINNFPQQIRHELEYFQSILRQGHVFKLRYVYKSFILNHMVTYFKYLLGDHEMECEAMMEGKEGDGRKANANEDINFGEHDKDLMNILINDLKVEIQKSCDDLTYEIYRSDEKFKEKNPAFFDEWQKSQQSKVREEIQVAMDETVHSMFILQENEIISNQFMEFFKNELFLLLCKFAETEIIKFPELKKYDYIMQQIVLHLQQMFIDADKFYGCETNKQFASEPYLRKYSKSQYIQEGYRSSKGYRSNGLAHNLLSFDWLYFCSYIIDDVFYISDYLDNLNRLLSPGNLSLVTELFNMGADLHRMEFYNESVKYQERALHRAKNHPEEVEKHQLDHEYVKIFGKPRMICRIYELIIICHSQSHQYEDMYKRLKEMIDCINMPQLDQCYNMDIKVCAGSFFFLMGEYFHTCKKDFIQALNFFNISDRLHDDCNTKYHLAYIHCELNNYDKARELFTFISKSDVDPEYKAGAKWMLLECNSLDRTALVTIADRRECINQNLNNRHHLKNILQDQYPRLDLEILVKDLNVIISESLREGMTSNNLKKLIEIEKKFLLFEENMSEEEISNLYLAFCEAHCLACYSVHIDLLGRENHLREATEYFIKSLEKPDSALHDSDERRLGFTEQHRNVVESLFSLHLICVKTFFRDGNTAFFIDFLSKLEPILPDLAHGMIGIIIDNYGPEIKELKMEADPQNESVGIKVLLAHCIKSRSLLQCDFQLLKSWFHYFFILSKFHSSNNHKMTLERQLEDVKKFLINLTKILLEIFYCRKDPIEPCENMVAFCHRKFDIKLSYHNDRRCWNYEGSSPNEELKNKIKQEMSVIGELFVTYIFVMGYYKEGGPLNSKD